MTQDVISLIGSYYANLWTLLAVVIGFSFVLLALVMVIPKNLEDEKPRKKEKEYKLTRQEKLINLCIEITMFCIIVAVIIIIFVVIGNELNSTMIDCANCTEALV